jgi:hypothetical protein
MHRLWILLLFLSNPLWAQPVGKSAYVGQWLLNGQREMAAGLELRADSSFEFFLSYGASDRYASGTWKVWGDSLVLHSRKPAGKDFLVQQQSPGGEGYRIRIQDPNPLLAEGVRCFAFSGGKKEIFQADHTGEIHIPWSSCDTLYLQHLYFPDIATLIKDRNNPNRDFAVKLSPDLAEISWKGIWFWMDVEGFLRCPTNYVLPMESIRFERMAK